MTYHSVNLYQLNIADLEKRLKEKTDEISGIERELKLLQIQVKSRSRLKKVRGRSKSPENSSGMFMKFSIFYQ